MSNTVRKFQSGVDRLVFQLISRKLALVNVTPDGELDKAHSISGQNIRNWVVPRAAITM
jgi:hypothetical protein